MNPLFRKFLGINWILFFAMMGLLIFGVFAIYSSSYMRTGRFEFLSLYYRRQMVMIIVGLAVFFVTALTDYRWIRWAALPAYFGGLVLLILLRFIGESRSGATSWLDFGPLNFQPSQVAIVGGIMIVSVALSELHRLHPLFENHLLRLGISVVLVSIPVVLIALEPDLGSAAVWAPVFGAMVVAATIPFRYLVVMGQVCLIALPLVYWFGLQEHQQERIDTYVAGLTGGEVDELGAGYDIKNVLIAVSTGGMEGKGFKGRRLKAVDPDKKTVTEMGFINPAVTINDYIFMVIGEQHGFRGSMLLVVGFALLLLMSLFIAFYSRDQMGRLLVVGVTMLFFVHVFVSIGMCVRLVPVTGLPLPLISYGGTFVCICMFLLGLVQSVWVHRGVKENLPERSIFYSLK